ncbi:MAG TPA: AraC family transcriptional regulator [Candidatus Agathobaculum merdigallinarum]|nr:AraC family transcriptional regulator [Candidatus Agathobaculum merdigallinarum]
MIQCFVKKEYEAPFGLTQPPRLFSVSRTDEKASAHPRVMHAHDDLVEIVLVRGGESRYFVGGTPYDARRGDLFIFNSRVVHDEPSGPDRPVATSSLALGGLTVPGLRENTLIPEDAPPAYRLSEGQTQRLERLYDVLFEELTAGNDDGAHHLLMAILTLVQQFRASADGSAADENVFAQRIKDYIDRHFAEEFSLQQMADALHVSPYHLSHVCKETTGYSPLQYVLRRRIGEAQTLLITTDLPVTRIAAQVGYDNPSHFNAQFAKAVGMPPRIFRREYVYHK